MRAITLWQPWASAMAMGLKRNETRSWPTGYRGDLVIHAAQRRVSGPHDVLETAAMNALPEAEQPEGPLTDKQIMTFVKSLPHGKAVCVVEVYDCVHSEEFISRRRKLSTMEWLMGDYTEGRHIWLTRNLRVLKPFPFKGKQGFFNIPDELVKEAMTEYGKQQ